MQPEQVRVRQRIRPVRRQRHDAGRRKTRHLSSREPEEGADAVRVWRVLRIHTSTGKKQEERHPVVTYGCFETELERVECPVQAFEQREGVGGAVYVADAGGRSDLREDTQHEFPNSRISLMLLGVSKSGPRQKESLSYIRTSSLEVDPSDNGIMYAVSVQSDSATASCSWSISFFHCSVS